MGAEQAWRADTSKAADRTRTGLLLLVIGAVLSAIPFISIVGALILLIAVILIYMGAVAFGEQHRMYVVWSIVTWILIFIGVLVSVVVIGLQLAAAIIEERPPAEMLSTWTAFVIAYAVGGAAFGIPYLLITYRLQEDDGRKVLWLAFVVQAGVLVGVAAALYSQMEAFINEIVSGYGTSLFLGGQLGPEALAGLTNLVWAYAFYLAYRRVADGRLEPVRMGGQQG